METIPGTATISTDGHGSDIRKGPDIPVRKKVLIIAPFHKGIGGAETYLYSLMDEASKECDVYLSSLSKPPENWQGTPIHKVLGICWELLRDAVGYRKLPIKTIDCHGLQAALVGLIMKQWWDFKFCVTVLALYDFKNKPWWFRFLCRTILNSADKVFVEGETGKRDLLDCGIRENKIVKFMHWIDLERFSPITRMHKGVRILFVGRPIPIKGKCVVEELEKKLFYVEALSFRYAENIPYHKLARHYQEADILIVPSQYPEGFARVVLEATACGCIVIVSDRGALPELVKYFGFVEHYEQVIMTLHGDVKEMRRLQKYARLYAERYFTSKNAETILKEY